MTTAGFGRLCSVGSQDLGESAYGSAASARFWLCLEQDGPWGRVAATGSHLDPEVGAALDALASAAGGRFALVRRPGRHADDGRPEHREHAVLVAWSDPHAPWLLRGRTTDPAQLLALGADVLARGDADEVAASAPALALQRDDRPELLVCTNGRRDLCCAVRGRPVALGAAARRPGQVWETSHTGGHRFSPTAVLLPSGQTLARLDVDLAVAALDGAAAGGLPPALHGPVHDRGVCGWPAPVTAAVSLVRAHAGEPRWDALAPAEVEAAVEGGADHDGGGRWTVQVRHTDGRAWSVVAERRVLGPDRPESCVKPAVPQVGWSVDLVSPCVPSSDRIVEPR